jgi:hypothetical protein
MGACFLHLKDNILMRNLASCTDSFSSAFVMDLGSEFKIDFTIIID